MTSNPPVSAWIRSAARFGLSARAIVYMLIGLLLLRTLLLSSGGKGEEASPTKAFLAIETQWWGKLALIAIGVGLALYLIWRFLQGLMDLDRLGDDAAARIGRLGMLASGVSYGLIAFAAFSVALDQNDTSGGGGTQETVRWLIGQPFGRWLVAIAGLALAGVGCAQIWRGVTGKWKDRIRLDDRTRWLEWISGYAIAGRGLLFLIASISIIWSGFTLAPDDALGLAETMGWLRRQPFGFWLYLASGLVVVGYGLYSALQAWRYQPGTELSD